MTLAPGVNFEELARSTDEFNGAQLKAVCVEAGMIALREGASKLNHEHYLSGIAEGGIPNLCPNPKSAVALTRFPFYSPEQEEEHSHVFRIVRYPIYEVLLHCLGLAFGWSLCRCKLDEICIETVGMSQPRRSVQSAGLGGCIRE